MDFIKQLLNEGTWSSPNEVEKARQLQQLMQKPIAASEASDQIYHLMGDDDLFDRIAEIEKEDPQADVRSVIADKLSEWISEGQRTGFARWKHEWDPEALDILTQIAKRYK